MQRRQRINIFCDKKNVAVVVLASDTRGPRFESSHRRNFIHVFTINCIEKTKIKIKEAGNCPFFLKKTVSVFFQYLTESTIEAIVMTMTLIHLISTLEPN